MRGATVRNIYKEIFEIALDGVLVTDAETDAILNCNPALRRMVGWKKSELLGKPRGQLFPEGSQGKKTPPKNKTKAARKTSKPVETVIFTKKGESKTVLLKTKSILLDGQKQRIDYIHALPHRPPLHALSDQVLLNILDSLDADVYVADMQTFEILFVNQHMRDSFGDKLVGKTCHVVFRKDQDPCSHCMNDRLIDKQGKPTGVQVWEGYNPVTKRWYSNADRAILWHDGRLVRLQIAVDITDRKMNEQELFQSRQMLQLILDNVPQRIFWKDRESRYLGCNLPFAQDAGLGDSHEVNGKVDSQLAWGTEADLFRSDDQEVMEKGISKINYEELLTHKDGSISWVRTSKVPLRNQQDEIFGVLGVYEDITEQKKFREALRLEKEHAQHYLDIAGVIILALDNEGNVTLINRKGLEILGFEEDEILGKNWVNNFLPEESREFVSSLFQNLVGGIEDKHKQAANFILTKDKQRRYIDWHNSVLRDKQGEIIGTLSSGADITERKKMEDELVRRAEELSALQETLLGITSKHSLPDLLNLIVERAVELLDGSGGGMYLTEPDARQVRCVVSHKTKKDYVGTTLPYGQGAAGIIAESGLPMVVDDYRTWEGRSPVFEKEKPFRALVATPLQWQEQVTGVLHVLRDENEKKFTQEDLFLLTIFANHAAVAVENARLYGSLTQELADHEKDEEEIRKQLAELETLHEIGLAVSHLLEPKAIGERIVTSFSQNLAWHHVSIRLRRGESDELELIGFNQPHLSSDQRRNVEQKFTKLVHKVGQGLSGQVVQTGKAILADNVHDYPGYVETHKGIKSGLYVPIKIGDRVIGCMAVESEESNAFKEDDERLLLTLATQTAVVFENARLYQEVQQELVERKRAEDKLISQTHELEALFSISTHLRSAQNIDEMLPMVLDEMARVLHTDSNAVLFLNENKTAFSYTLGTGVFKAAEGLTIDVTEDISGRVYSNGTAYISGDYATDPLRVANFPGTDRLGPAIFVPLQSETDIQGILVGVREKSKNSILFNEREQRLLSAVGEMVGNALRRMRLFDEVLKRMSQVQALHSVDMAIASSIDAKTALDIILSQVVAHLDADAAAILLFKPETQILEYSAVLGFKYQEIRRLQLWPGEGIAGNVVQSRQLVSVLNVEDIQNSQTKALLLEKFCSYHGIPMFVKGQVCGVLEIYYRKTQSLEGDQVEFLEALAAQAAIAIDNAELFTNLQRSNLDLILAYDATIEGWSQAMDLRDPSAENDTQRVIELTLALARELGLREELNQIRWGALLHDIGMIGVPDDILNKPSSLTEEEWKIVHEHPVFAYRMISPIVFLRNAIDIPYCHHEKWDGSGYPRGLKEEEIPFAARIFAVVDVWDALCSDRTYRKAWSRDEALAHIQAGKGKHFDPAVVDVFVRLIQAIDEA
jgi:PAS domain S-box-containing protein